MKKKIINVIILTLTTLSLIGCGATSKNDTREVSGEIVNVESTAIVSKDITIKTEKGNEIIMHDIYGDCKQTKYGTKINVILDASNKLKSVEYIWGEE